MNIGQGTISDAERGRTRITLDLLGQFADALRKPLFHFLPSVAEADLSRAEQHLILMFRQLGPRWRSQLIEYVGQQLRLYQETHALSRLSGEKREIEAWNRAEELVRDELPLRALTLDELEERVADWPEEEQQRILAAFISIVGAEHFSDLLVMEKQDELLRHAQDDDQLAVSEDKLSESTTEVPGADSCTNMHT